MTQWGGLLIFFLLFFPPLSPFTDLARLYIWSHPSVFPLLLLTWEGMSSLQELAVFCAFFFSHFLLPFQTLCPTMVIPHGILTSLPQYSQLSIIPVATTSRISFLRGGHFSLTVFQCLLWLHSKDMRMENRIQPLGGSCLCLTFSHPLPKYTNMQPLIGGYSVDCSMAQKILSIVHWIYTSSIPFLHLELAGFLYFWRAVWKIASCPLVSLFSRGL